MQAVEEVVETLEGMSKTIETKEEVCQVATISANSEVEIGYLAVAQNIIKEDGLWGSHYTAKILEVTKQKAKVEFDVCRPKHRPVPPSLSPALAFLRRLSTRRARKRSC